MTTKKNLVKQVLMSTLTVGIIAMIFTACSDNDVMNEPSDLQAAQTAPGEPLDAVGLVYNDFITPNDVQILDADTTQISISKEYAEKQGINNFVNRPMGIWLTFRERSFLRKGISQHLEGDRYIVEVAEATIEEVLQPGKELNLKTEMFVNPAAAEQAQTRGAGGLEGSQLMESLFTDDEGCIHPAAIQFIDADVTRSGVSPSINYSPIEILGMTDDNVTRGGVLSTIWDIIKGAAKAVIDPFGINEAFLKAVTDGQKPGNYNNNLVNYNDTKTITAKFQCGEGKDDSITIRGKIPMKIMVNYMLNLKVGGSKLSPRMDYFRAYLDGEMRTAPELTIGYSKTLEIPKDLQKINIHTFEGASVTFVVYGIPINITFKPSLYFKLKAKCEGSLYTGIKYEYGSKFIAGAEYKDSQWKNLSKIEPIKSKFSFIPPTGNFKVDAGVGVMLGCDILFEKVVGPSIAAGPQLALNLDLKVTPTAADPITFKGTSKFGFWGEVGAKVAIWKWDILKYYNEFDFGLSRTFWEYNYPDAKNDKNSPLVITLDMASDHIRSLQDQMK